MKTCPKCGKTKPLNEFYQYKGTYQFQCKKCAHAYQSALRKRKNTEAICVDCGRKIHTVHKNHIRCKECGLKHNRKKQIERASIWNKENPDKRAALFKRLHNRMPDWYIIDIYRTLGWNDTQITPDLIAAKRALIKIKRAVREIA